MEGKEEKMNKKSNFLDWFYIIAILFLAAVSIFASTLIITTLDDTGIFADDVEANAAMQKSKSALLSTDNIFIFIVIGLSIFVLVSSALVFNHPAYFFIGMFLLFIAVIVSATISNSFWTFSNQATVAATAALYPKITFLMNHLPLYVAFMGIAASITAYVAYLRT